MYHPARQSTHYTVVSLCTLAFVATMVARVVISPVVPDLTTHFRVSTGAIGLALSGMWAAYAIAQFPSGFLADQYGERIVILVAIGGTGTTSLLLALSPSYIGFFVFTVSLGAAAGLVYSAAVSLVAKQPTDTGRTIGLYIAGGPLAGVIAPPIAAAVALRYDWRAAIAIGGIVAFPVLVLFWYGVETTPAAQADVSLRDQLALRSLFELMSRPAMIYTTILAILGAFTWQSVASFLPAYLETFHGYSRTSAGLLFSAYFVVHGLTQPFTGYLSDRFTRNAAALLTMTAGVVGFGILLTSATHVAILVGIGLVGLAMSWGAPLQTKFMDNLSEAEQGTGFGLVRMVYMSIGSLGSFVTGTIVDVAGWSEAFGLLGILMAIGALLLLIGTLDRGLRGR